MEKEKPNKQNKPGKEKKEGYIIVPNSFLKEWVSILGVGPVVLYQELLTYCHKEKYIAWPTIDSLCQQMGIAKTTLLRYQNTLVKFGLIKNITRGKSTTGHYRNNIYQVISLEELTKHPDPGKIINFVGSKMKPDWYQNDTNVGSKMILSLVSKRYPNNTNLNITNLTATTKREKDAVAAAVNFKKLKEKGDLSAPACAYPHADRCNAQAEEKMQAPFSSKEHYTGQAIRERMVELDFKEEFIEKILKEYPSGKIEEKLDLLMERKNIQSPAAWLSAALKNNYQGEEPSLSFPQPSLSFPRRRESSECHDESRIDSRFHGNDKSGGGNDIKGSGNDIDTPEWTSREDALKAIKLIQDSLSACISPIPSGSKGAVLRKKVGV